MNTDSLIGTIGNVFLVILGFILIVYLAYFSTKKIGKRLSFSSVNNKNIKVIDSISIGQNKALMIIETAGKILLVGITQNEISLITELDRENILFEDNQKSGQPMDFSKAFKTVLEEKFGKKIKTKENKDDSSKE